ncbi:MAG: hypothetical protein LBS50_05620 [Prevotellaceae bacterium]|jgi:hypothetical protein|nr:hypothetical protein [Prevotellaceae bacterium]
MAAKTVVNCFQNLYFCRIDTGGKYYNESVKKQIKDDNSSKEIYVEFNADSISHFANDMMYGKKYWIKNEIIYNLDNR